MNVLKHLIGAKNLDEDITTAIILRSDGANIPIYTPVLAKKEDGAIRASLLFPTVSGVKARSSFFLNESSIVAIPEKGLLSKRCIKTIDEFRFEKVRKIQEFIKSEGAVTFIIEDVEKADMFLKRLSYLRKEFMCAAYCNYASGGYTNPITEKDMLTLAITASDLMYAIPIYNKKKASGIAFSATFFWPDSSNRTNNLVFAFELYFLVNDYYDNIVYVDGQRIQDDVFISDKTISSFSNVLSSEKERRNKIMAKVSKKK